MLLSVERPHIPDVRDAREQQNAVFEQFVNVSVLAEEISSVNTEEICAAVTVTVRIKFTLKLSVVDMANH
jgi:hypothetical protein